MTSFATSHESGGSENPALPGIIINDRQFIEVINDAWEAAHIANQPIPLLFQRYGLLVSLRRADEDVSITALKLDDIYGFLLRMANWFKREHDALRPARPPDKVARDMLAHPNSHLPHLDSVTLTPIFGRGGDIIAQMGYYESDRIFCFTRGDRPLVIPAAPSAAQVEQARKMIIQEALGDFPFESPADRAHAMAALLLPFARRMITGCTPLHAVSAPTPGSGKGLLCNLISIIFTGAPCASRTLSAREEEARKMFTAELSTGRQIVLLDNAREFRLIDNIALASVLTAQIWTDRLLGHTKMVTVPNKALWLLTGNNINLSLELRRRTVPIRLLPKIATPWLQKGFRHPDLLGWVKAQRDELIRSALILIQAWIAAGRPLSEQRLGSFEDWSQVMGGILENAGIEGFLGNLGEFLDSGNLNEKMWMEFVAAWWLAYGDAPQSVNELNGLCHQGRLMELVRGEGTLRSQQTALGIALYEARDRTFGIYQILLHRDRGHRGKLYRLRLAESKPRPAATTEMMQPEVPQVPLAPASPGASQTGGRTLGT